MYPIKERITKVNGIESARAYNLTEPDCSVALIDENNKYVYIVRTDGTGYKTVEKYRLMSEKDKRKAPRKK